MRFAIVFVALVASVAAGSSLTKSTREPSVTMITAYPYLVALLRNTGFNSFYHHCSGIIINNRAFLTSARCVGYNNPANWRGRIGSSFANHGGVVHTISSIRWANFDHDTLINDIAILRTTRAIEFNIYVRPASLAGSSYVVPDNDAVYSVGWGYLGFPSGTATVFWQTHEVQVSSINTNVCRNHLQNQGYFVQNSMLCSGFAQPSTVSPYRARDKCFGEVGGPLVHQNTVVGVRSWALGCSNVETPTVNTRISSFNNWIQANA